MAPNGGDPSFSLNAATLSDDTQTATTSVDENNYDDTLYPGLQEDDVFDCDYSVDLWKNFVSEGNDGNVRKMFDTISKRATKSNLSRAYWGSQILRSGYFTVNAVLGSLASDLHGRFISQDSTEKINTGASPILNSNSHSAGMMGRIINSDIPSRLLRETIQAYEQDFKYVEEKLMKFPWDSLVKENKIQLDHRQANPLFVLSETTRTIRESVGIFSRRNKQAKGSSWMDRGYDDKIYPDYYKNDFHYQTDGWMSTESAERYESSTETLFLGRQDAMQRQTMIPLLRSNKKLSSILEVACGTGRFGTFLRDNYPEAEVTFSDLSPYYLEKAKRNDEYWRSYRGEDSMEESSGRKTKPASAKFVQAKAESLPFDDNSFDAVACVYLFHEMPKEARAQAAAEMVRVVKPGGIISLTDSNQLGDRPPLDDAMDNFSYLNEPHYSNYIRTYLPGLFEGCEMGEKYVASSSKTLSFIKKV